MSMSRIDQLLGKPGSSRIVSKSQELSRKAPHIYTCILLRTPNGTKWISGARLQTTGTPKTPQFSSQWLREVLKKARLLEKEEALTVDQIKSWAKAHSPGRRPKAEYASRSGPIFHLFSLAS